MNRVQVSVPQSVSTKEYFERLLGRLDERIDNLDTRCNEVRRRLIKPSSDQSKTPRSAIAVRAEVELIPEAKSIKESLARFKQLHVLGAGMCDMIWIDNLLSKITSIEVLLRQSITNACTTIAPPESSWNDIAGKISDLTLGYSETALNATVVAYLQGDSVPDTDFPYDESTSPKDSSVLDGRDTQSGETQE